MNQIPQIFSRRKIIMHRMRSAKMSDEHEFMPKEVESRLTERLDDITGNFENALLSGYFSSQLPHILISSRACKNVIMQDYFVNNRHNFPYVAADIEQLPFKNNSFNLIASNLMLHLANDLPGALIQLHNCLSNNGVLLASMFGGESLFELRKVLAESETELYGGISPRISPAVDVKALGGLVQRAGFSNPVTDSDIIKVAYDNIFDLMYDLRGMGEANALIAGNRPLTRELMAMANNRYKEMFSDGEDGIIATFDIINITGLAAKSN